MNNKKFPWIIAICAVVVGVASFIMYSYNDVSNRVSTARGASYVILVGNSFVEVIEDARINDPSLLPTKITADQLADYISEAKENAINPWSGPVDTETAAGIRAVTFSQRDGDSFQLIAGDDVTTATMTLYDDAAWAAHYVMNPATGT
jgi:hypothetical protein